MLAKILGVIWILLGFLWLVKPEALRKRLQRKMNRRVKWIVYGFILVFGFLIIGSVIRAPGIPAKIAGIVGIIITVKAVILITSKASQKIIDWWAKKPLIFFRIWGLFVFVTGILLFTAYK